MQPIVENSMFTWVFPPFQCSFSQWKWNLIIIGCPLVVCKFKKNELFCLKVGHILTFWSFKPHPSFLRNIPQAVFTFEFLWFQTEHNIFFKSYAQIGFIKLVSVAFQGAIPTAAYRGHSMLNQNPDQPIWLHRFFYISYFKMWNTKVRYVHLKVFSIQDFQTFSYISWIIVKKGHWYLEQNVTQMGVKSSKLWTQAFPLMFILSNEAEVCSWDAKLWC